MFVSLPEYGDIVGNLSDKTPLHLHHPRKSNDSLCSFIPSKVTEVAITVKGKTYHLDQKHRFGERAIIPLLFKDLTYLKVQKTFYEAVVTNASVLVPHLPNFETKVQLENMERVKVKQPEFIGRFTYHSLLGYFATVGILGFAIYKCCQSNRSQIVNHLGGPNPAQAPQQIQLPVQPFILPAAADPPIVPQQNFPLGELGQDQLAFGANQPSFQPVGPRNNLEDEI